MSSHLDPAQRYDDAVAAIGRLIPERADLMEQQASEPDALAVAWALVAEIEREVRVAEKHLAETMERMASALSQRQALGTAFPDERRHLANLRDRLVNERSILDRLPRDSMERRRRLEAIDQDLASWQRRRDQALASMRQTETTPAVSG